MGTSPLRFFTVLRDGGDIARFEWQGRPACLVNEPELVEHVLGVGRGNYVNPHHEYADLEPILTPAGRRFLGLGQAGAAGDGGGSAITEGGSLVDSTGFAEVDARLRQAADALFAQLDAISEPSAAVDAVELLKVLMLRLFTRLLFAVEADQGAVLFQHAAAQLEVESVQVRAGSGAPAVAELDLRRTAEVQDSYARNVLAARAEALGAETVERASRLGTPHLHRAVLRTLLNAYNAMATTAAWSLYLLCLHPRVEAEIVRELDQELAGRRPCLRDAARLPRLRGLIAESMRLYPSAWLLGRTARVAEALGREHIAAGTLVYVSPYTLHRDPRFWPEPDAFRPERFAQPDARRPRAAYLPFGGGPRRCPAKPLSLPALTVLLAEWLGRYRTELATGVRVVPWPLISLRPHPALPVNLRPRESSR